MNKAPSIWHLSELLRWVENHSASKDGVKYYPARPIGWGGLSSRFQYAWLVFTGKADAVIWPEGQ